MGFRTELAPSASFQNKFSMDAKMAGILARHNHYRCMHKAPAMTWDAAIAANAQAWAQATGGVMRHSPPNLRSNVAGFRNLGENLMWGNTGTYAVDSWYNEIRLTNGGRTNVFSPQTGHYTQVVWEGSTKLGCGAYKSLLVCQYGPAGNMIGHFGNQVKAPTVPGQCNGGANTGNGIPGNNGANPGTNPITNPTTRPGNIVGGNLNNVLPNLQGQSTVNCRSICTAHGKGVMRRWQMYGRGSTWKWTCTCTGGVLVVQCEGRPFKSCSLTR